MSEMFNDDFLISSQDYANVMDAVVIPELDQLREIRHVPVSDREKLFCSVFRAENACGTVLIVHGFKENTYKFSELIYSLVKNHFSVVAYDQRGHGYSGRSSGLPDSSVTHVDHFEDYVEDLRTVCNTALSECPKPWSVLCHSMGGAVTALYLEKYHDTFVSAAMCSPMIAPNVGGLPCFFVKIFSSFNCLLGKGKFFPPFMKTYSGPDSFETSRAADPVRFKWYESAKAAHREFQNSVPSYRWILEAVNVTKKILASGAPEAIICPVLLSASDIEESVMPKPQKTFISRVPKGSYLFVKGTRHEIYRSCNTEFFPWWNRILSFLKEAAA